MNPEDLTDDDAVIVCVLKGMPHIGDVVSRECDFCGREVWLTESTNHPEGFYVCCVVCAQDHFNNEPVQVPDDDQIRDIANHLGIPFDDVKKKVHDLVEMKNRGTKYESN
jgi:DNA polymerase III epsilon subunit-like protein